MKCKEQQTIDLVVLHPNRLLDIVQIRLPTHHVENWQTLLAWQSSDHMLLTIPISIDAVSLSARVPAIRHRCHLVAWFVGRSSLECPDVWVRLLRYVLDKPELLNCS